MLICETYFLYIYYISFIKKNQQIFFFLYSSPSTLYFLTFFFFILFLLFLNMIYWTAMVICTVGGVMIYKNVFSSASSSFFQILLLISRVVDMHWQYKLGRSAWKSMWLKDVIKCCLSIHFFLYRILCFRASSSNFFFGRFLHWFISCMVCRWISGSLVMTLFWCNVDIPIFINETKQKKIISTIDVQKKLY